MSIRQRLNWLRPSTKRLAFMMGIYAQGDDPWYPQDVWNSIKPPWKTSHWDGVYPILENLENAGLLVSGLELGHRWYRWYRRGTIQ